MRGHSAGTPAAGLLAVLGLACVLAGGLASGSAASRPGTGATTAIGDTGTTEAGTTAETGTTGTGSTTGTAGRTGEEQGEPTENPRNGSSWTVRRAVNGVAAGTIPGNVSGTVEVVVPLGSSWT
jgi:hypothetical protein